MSEEEAEGLLSASQVADLLGLNVYTVRQLLRDGELEGYKIMNKKWRVKLSAIQKFLDKYKGDS